MQVSDMNPFVRFARDCEHSFTAHTLVAPDHRLFYCISGSAVCSICSRSYPLSAGSVIYWPSGSAYRVICGKDTVIAGCNFDFLQENAALSAPICPTLSGREPCRVLETVHFNDTALFDAPFVLHHAYVLEEKFLHLAEEYNGKQLYFAPKCSSLLKEILIDCLQLSETCRGSKSAALAQEVLRYIRLHYNRNLTNTEIGAHFSYHPNYLNSLVIRHTGKSMHQYLLAYRVNAAVNLLQSGTHSVSEVAVMVGIPDLKHFSKVFKHVLGVPPSRFKLS